MRKWLPSVPLCTGLALAAAGALLFVKPSLRLGVLPAVAWFALAALSLGVPALIAAGRVRRVAAVAAVLCVLAAAGSEFGRYRAAQRVRADEERLKRVLPMETRDVSLGGPAPAIEGADLSGRPMKLSEHRGKVVLLVFWASWCGPCMGDVPHEKVLVERFAGRPFVLVGVNGDVTAERGRAAEKKHAITWRSFWDGGESGDGGDGPIAAGWGVRAWPTVYVIDDQGVVRHNDLRGDALDAPLERLVRAAEARAAGER